MASPTPFSFGGSTSSSSSFGQGRSTSSGFGQGGSTSSGFGKKPVVAFSGEKDGKSCCPTLDFAKLLDDEIFTFFIGAKKKRFNIHVNALSAISKPLGYMMTNGKMEESLKKEAFLEDVDPEVFAQLAKFAYIGLYAIADGYAHADGFVDKGFRSSTLLPPRYRCCGCGQICNGMLYPFCTPACRSLTIRDPSAGQIFAATPQLRCVHVSCTSVARLLRPNILCSDHAAETKTYPKVDIAMNVIYEPAPIREAASVLECSDSFTKREYGCNSMTHEALHTHIQTHKSGPLVNRPLSHHAKLYVLAKKYMIDDLPDICLHVLHHNLVVFHVNATAIWQLIELVLYTYQNTEEGGDVLEGTGDKLRELVIAYVSDRAGELTGYKAFADMIGSGGQHTTDFLRLVCRGKKEIKA